MDAAPLASRVGHHSDLCARRYLLTERGPLFLQVGIDGVQPGAMIDRHGPPVTRYRAARWNGLAVVIAVHDLACPGRIHCCRIRKEIDGPEIPTRVVGYAFGVTGDVPISSERRSSSPGPRRRRSSGNSCSDSELTILSAMRQCKSVCFLDRGRGRTPTPLIIRAYGERTQAAPPPAHRLAVNTPAFLPTG